MHKKALVILTALMLWGCSSSDVCMQKTDTALRVTLHRVRYDQAGERYVAERATTTVTLHGLGIDSLLYRSAPTSELVLPLNPTDSATTFVIEQLSPDSVARQDTLTIRHSNRLEFISLECGVAKLYDIRAVEHTSRGIDSVVVENATVDRQELNNLKIYIRQ